MRTYKQLSHEERVKLSQLMQSKTQISKIASEMSRSRSTIYRELKRNEAPPGEYWPDTAHHKSRARRIRGSIIDRDSRLQAFIRLKLCQHFWTPEQIAGYLKHRQTQKRAVSHETIYAWLYQKAQKIEKLWKFLPRHKARRGLRKSKGMGQGRIPHRTSIHDRPKVGGRKRKLFGHWEGDLMSFRKNSEHMVVLRERKSMLTLSSPLSSKRAPETAKVMIQLLKEVPKAALRTITFDNGGEFAGHVEVCRTLGIQSYFCDPYASWQKGGVENTNGRLRRDLPRKTSLKRMTEEDFEETIDNYNRTPRKKLGWLTPLEAFNKNLNRVALPA